MNTIKSVIVFSFLICIIIGCNPKNSELKGKTSKAPITRDLNEILHSDTLKVIMAQTPTSYFLYKGVPMGFDNDLINRFAKQMGLKIEIVVLSDLDSIFSFLSRGKGDVAAYPLTVTKKRKKLVKFTLPLNLTRQVLVQKKPDNWRKMKLHEIENMLLRNPLNLVDKEIFIRENSSYHERLLNLEEELGIEIDIQFLSGNISTDEILRKVNSGEIQYTVADENIARINKASLPDIDIKTPIGIMQQLSWAVNTNSPKLLDTLNYWLTEMRKKDEFYVLYNKYYKNSRAYKSRVKSEMFALESNQISPYDELIKLHSKSIGWDWRLLTALMYRESKFDKNIESWAGAIGLMQVMPMTAKEYGIENLLNAEDNIVAGVKHIQYLNNYWKNTVNDSLERVKFILASYNVGQNHVQDARRLAITHSLNPNVWFDHVEKMILLKSDKEFYTQEPVKFGYCRGSEPVEYVKEILSIYEGYKDFIPL